VSISGGIRRENRREPGRRVLEEFLVRRTRPVAFMTCDFPGDAWAGCCLMDAFVSEDSGVGAAGSRA
jgi:hypothetical protein